MMNSAQYESLRVRLSGYLFCYAGLMLGLAVPLVYGWFQRSLLFIVWSAALSVALLIGAACWLARQLMPVTDGEAQRDELMRQVNELTIKLHQSQEWLGKAFFSNPVPLSLTHLETRTFIEVNESFERLSGYTRAELVASTPAVFNLGFSDEEAKLVYDRLRRDGTIRSYETTIRFKDGLPRAILGAAELFELAGRPCVLWSHQDITTRLQTETELRLSEERFATAFQSNPCAMSIVRLSDGVHLDVNEKWLREVQMKREDVMGRTGAELPVWREPADREKVYELLRTKGSIHGLELALHPSSVRDMTGLISAQIIVLNGERCVLFIVQDISERKRAEKALQDREERLRLTMQAAGLGAWEYDIAQACGIWTPEYAALFGLQPADFDGTNEMFLSLLHPDDRHIVNEAFQRGLAGDPHYAAEFRVILPDGSERWQSSLGRTLYDEQGQATRMIGVGQDITERKRAEAALRDREEHLRLAMQAGGLGTWEVNITEWRAYWTSEYAALFDLAVEDFDGQPETFFKLIHPDDVPVIKQAFTHALSGEPPRIVEYRRVMPDGSYRWHTSLGQLLFNETGKAKRVIGVGMDITERKLAETALRDREERLRLSLQAAGMGTWLFDVVQQRGEWSPEYEALYGLTPGTYDGTNEFFFARVHPDDAASVRRAFRRGLKGNPVYQIDFRYFHEDGSLRWQSNLGRMRYDAKGQAAHVIGVGLDVTERKQAEQALQASRTQLRQLAARLQNAREAERAEIARNIHDDLGQSMTGLKFLLKWLESQLTPEQIDARAKVGEMLEMSSAAIGQIRRVATSLRPGILDDFGLVAALEWQAQEFAQRTGVACRLSVKPKEAEIEALERDRATAFFRIFQEALTNVTRHAEAASVDAQLFRQDDALVLHIHDDGRGITVDELVNVRSLGLLGMRERAEMFNGSFTIAAGEPRGTLVTVRIPLRSQ
ncbi:MAG: PAS domain S-box protein [Acidobacteria bacterium]|nr:PAS domain S-box protein [Acidobacteriota bacterium]